MGCDIHLRLEIKLRRDKKWGDLVLESAGVWMPCNIFSFRNTWGDRVPAMFSRLTGGSGIDSEPIPLRGFPVDCCEATLQCYGLRRSRRKTEEIIRKLRGEDAQGDQGEAVSEQGANGVHQ